MVRLIFSGIPLRKNNPTNPARTMTLALMIVPVKNTSPNYNGETISISMGDDLYILCYQNYPDKSAKHSEP
jgi:hypothetical protein